MWAWFIFKAGLELPQTLSLCWRFGSIVTVLRTKYNILKAQSYRETREKSQGLLYGKLEIFNHKSTPLLLLRYVKIHTCLAKITPAVKALHSWCDLRGYLVKAVDLETNLNYRFFQFNMLIKKKYWKRCKLIIPSHTTSIQWINKILIYLFTYLT